MAVLNSVESLFTTGYPPWIALILAGIFLLGVQKLQVKNDHQEPPLLKPKFPIFGHLIGLLWYRVEYYSQLGSKNPDLPIFTMPLGVAKVYIIASPQLVQQAMRKKTLSFDPLAIAFSEKMVGFGPGIMNLMHHPPTDGSESWLEDQHRAYEPLAPGPALHEMNTHVLNRIAQTLNDVGPDYETKKFYLWLRDAFTVATTAALFGAKNPLTEDPRLNDYLWDYETGQIDLLTRPFPSLTAQKPYRGRTELQKALRAYFHAGYDKNSDVSAVIKNRAAINRRWGMATDDVADHELGMLFVSTTNAIPTLFWMIFYVFRDPQLVADLQVELLQVLKKGKETNGQRECTFNIKTFSTACPLLVSTYQEVMRLTNRQMGTRSIIEDTYLTYTPVGEGSGTPTTYLLKKGVQIQMPAPITNHASATWGPDVNAFDARRFITSREKERQQQKAFNPFGGGKHLCPGRHFAYAEILGAVAVLVLGFEIETPTGERVTVPAINNNLAEAVGKPLQTFQQNYLTRMRRKPGWEDVKWGFVTGSNEE